MLPKQVLNQLLSENFKLGEAEITDFSVKAQKNNKDLEQYLIDENIVNELELYTKASEKLEVPFVSLKGKEIKKEKIELIAVESVREALDVL